MIIQFCGLSGSGKSTIANQVKKLLEQDHLSIEIIDGDEYRKLICSDLGFSMADRKLNIRRLAFIASKLSSHQVIAIICAINPYEDVRHEIASAYPDVKTIYIECNLNKLIERDTKGLYQKALLPEGDPGKISNLTGVNDPFEPPLSADLTIHTDAEGIEESASKLYQYIKEHYNVLQR